MPKIRCLYEECVFLAKGFCSAASIELDPEDGCLTYSEEVMDIANNNVFEEEVDDDFDETWEDAGFEELEDLDLTDEEY
ncbi:MAG: hypothetical protein OEY93_01130 [Anaerolineae bacterium]|nr:hypothetical protein [Anaerolineae bacterium]